MKDLEDLCTICEPFPSAGKDVTRFPMKVKKKGPRVEASVVTVVRLGSGPERVVLMSQRPATGMSVTTARRGFDSRTAFE